MRFRSGVSELQASWFDSPGLQSFSFKKALNPWLFFGGKIMWPRFADVSARRKRMLPVRIRKDRACGAPSNSKLEMMGFAYQSTSLNLLPPQKNQHLPIERDCFNRESNIFQALIFRGIWGFVAILIEFVSKGWTRRSSINLQDTLHKATWYKFSIEVKNPIEPGSAWHHQRWGWFVAGMICFGLDVYPPEV